MSFSNSSCLLLHSQASITKGSWGRNGSQAAAVQNGSAASASGSASASVTLPDGSCVVRRKVDDDNSCLFSAVAYVMEGSRAHATKLRSVCLTVSFSAVCLSVCVPVCLSSSAESVHQATEQMLPSLYDVCALHIPSWQSGSPHCDILNAESLYCFALQKGNSRCCSSRPVHL